MICTGIHPFQRDIEPLHIKPCIAFPPEFYSFLKDNLIDQVISGFGRKDISRISF